MNKIKSLNNDQRGAALVTVLLVSLLLVTACAAMLSAVGASSKNNTDALTEAKSYWAAESGLQATISYLRNTPNMTYSAALAQQTAGTLPVSGPNGVGTETSYRVVISDPDNSEASTTYTTTGVFAVTSAGPWESTKYFPDSTAVDRTELTYVPPPSAPITFNHPDTAPYPHMGSFRVTKVGNGGTITQVLFRIDYQMIEPRPDTRSIRGTIAIGGSGPEIDYDFYSYQLSGGTIALCPSDQCVTSGTEFANISLSVPVAGSADTPNYARIGPVDPYRLKVLSTGYGPNGAVKQLEGIIQKNFFNDSAGGSPLQMMGPNANFQPGPSSRMEINGGSAPSVGVCDATSLNTVNTAHTNGTLTPPPAITCNETPAWLSNPIALDQLVQRLRQSASNSGRYFLNTSPSNTQGWGNFTTGTGLTFCEGSCTLGGNNEGGGILVVTGTLLTSGNPRFKGLVLVTGPYVDTGNPGGIVRNGGGNEVFIGNIVVAPYNPTNLTSTWTMSPIYNQQGGPGDLINSSVDVDNAFNGTGAISNFMLGIAEK
jgi:Tfp pilus assembly protein PilX